MTNIIFLICLCLHFCNQAESLVGLILYSILIVIMKTTFVASPGVLVNHGSLHHHPMLAGLVYVSNIFFGKSPYP
ncbi:hypothetical protein Ahy_A07g034831 isoform A [Arachis hypogaea]|uniref:Uncharacterized protein n=1 Tax=Arachis hypogaea TaxID=3818 RepID=A0A445CCU2_ARAHY|nr:hypothetical protein Ahy_A07g034831 isoform A [Arachis hypogaea]